MTNNNLTVKEYTVLDKENVINLFKLNTPKYFSLDEENDLKGYLENEELLYPSGEQESYR